MTLAHLFRSALTCISPVLNTKVTYFMKFKKRLDLKEPKDLKEKILWLKLRDYETNPLVRQCADKYAVRSYVQEKGCEDILVPLIAAYDTVDEIDWEALPEAFAMKWNFGCGFNIICPDKSKLDIPRAVEKLKKWGKTRYHLGYSEMQYKDVPKKIIVEQYLKPESGTLPEDYKIYCFNGKPLAVLFLAGRNTDNMQAVFMDPQWNLLGQTGKAKYKELTAIPSRPVALEQLLKCAEKLSQPFEFVRVDFYEIDGRVYFGELTFTPAGGFDVSQCMIDGKTMGELLEIKEGTENEPVQR